MAEQRVEAACVGDSKPPLGTKFCRVEKSGLSRQSHNLKIAGSNPAPATNLSVLGTGIAE